MPNTRLIFDKDYYRLQAIFHSAKFSKHVRQLRIKLRKLGLPLPTKGFSTAKDYYDWTDKLHEKGLSPGRFIEEILVDFNIMDTESDLKVGLSFKIYFGKEYTPIKPTIPYNVVAQDEHQIELNIKLFNWTRQSDWESFWNKISDIRKQTVLSNSKNKNWETFERDFEVYKLFLKVKDDISHGFFKEPLLNSKSPYKQIAYYGEFNDLQNLYPEIDLEDSLRSIISQCTSYFSDLNLL